MTHEHHLHEHTVTSLNKAFILGIALNVAFVVVEFAVGLCYGSMGLLSDAGHNLSDVASLLLAMLVCIVLGMGLPTAAAYIIASSTIATALIKLGVPVLGAHMFLFYFSSIACITPPVAIASYAGAALADANPSKVGWEAVRLGIVAFLIPYSFCLTPGVIMLDFSSFATGNTGDLSALHT